MSRRRILIIGHSDGIGAAVASALIDRGDEVIGVSRSAGPPATGPIRQEVHDVTAPDYSNVLTRLLDEVGEVDACIYCVGIASDLDLSDLSHEVRVFDANLTALVRTMAVLVPHWMSRRRGHFIGLSSLADAIALPNAPSYAASKTGVSRYLRSMSLALRPHGIVVTNIRFGFVDTKMARGPRKPLMMTRARAAHHVLRCLDRRPTQLSVPKLIAAAVWIVGLAQSVAAWIR